MKELTRRQFGKAAAASAALAGLALPELSPSQTSGGEPASSLKVFCGAAPRRPIRLRAQRTKTGADHRFGMCFRTRRAKRFNGDTGDVADDSYHLYKEDVRLLKNLGASVYRMSISWSRIFPEGTGQPNRPGLDHYQRVVDELLANGITPYVTLFHWDLPRRLPAAGSRAIRRRPLPTTPATWRASSPIACSHFMTTNEFVCFTDLSYRDRPVCAGAAAARGGSEPGAASRNSGAWTGRAGHPRQCAGGAGGPGRESQRFMCPVIEDRAEH